MAELNINSTTEEGISVSGEAAAAGGDTFANNGRVVLKVENGGTSTAETVTVTAQKKCPRGVLHDIEINVPTESTVYAGPFDPEWFNLDGMVSISYSDETNLTVTAIKVD